MYQQTPQALSIDEYLPQVVYEPYKARNPLPVPPEEVPVAEGEAEEPSGEGQSEEEASHAD